MGARNQRALQQALRTVEDKHPNAIREHIGSTFLQLTGLDSAALLSATKTEQGYARSCPLVVDVSHDDGRAERMRDFLTGTYWSDAFFDPARPKLRETERFHRYEELAGADWNAPGGIFDLYHAQFGYRDSARVLVYDDLHFSQYVGVQDARQAGLVGSALHEANTLLPSLAAGLVFAVRKDQELLDRRPTLVVGANGQVLEASRAAAEWLDSGRRAMIGSLVRQFDRTADDESEGMVDFARYRIVRLVESTSRYIVMLDRVGLTQRTNHALLTGREQEVADLLVAGATVRETAKWLDMSENTAKNHIRSIYRKLAVANRAELVHALT